MKRFFIAILIVLICGTAYATDLRWDAPEADPTTNTQVLGYTVYFSSDGVIWNYDAGVNLFVTDIDVKLELAYGKTYTFHVTAYNDAGESGPSNTATYTTDDAYVPPGNKTPGKGKKNKPSSARNMIFEFFNN